MNTVVENQAKCLATLHIEFPPDEVAKERKSIADEFVKHAAIPGFRPGKAPRAAIESRFEARIAEELSKELHRLGISGSIKEKNLSVINVNRVEDVKFSADGSAAFTATVTLTPEFTLPDYSNIPSNATLRTVTDEEVENFVKSLCAQHATFEAVEGRPVAMDDFAVLTYEATLDGQPLKEAHPDTPRQLCGQQNAWLLMADASMAPGFCDALVGMAINDKKDFSISLPADFPIAPLAGKTLDYSATLHGIQTRNVPELNDELAAKISKDATAESLRTQARERLDFSAQQEFENAKRMDAMRYLAERTQFDPPETLVAERTQSLLRNIVRENQARGVSDDELTKHHEEIIASAQKAAHEQVQGDFLLMKIAETEKIDVSNEELSMEVFNISMQSGVDPKQLIKDIKKNNAYGDIRQQVLRRKAMDHLVKHVTTK